MATPTSWAQEVITCDLCPKPTQQFCNNCQVSLCVDCVSKHVDKFKSLAHDIVHFSNRKILLVFPECTIHANQRCEAHCQKCDVHVCLKCIFGSHNGHNILDMQEIFNDKKNEIERENQEIESIIISQYKNKVKDTESKLSETTAKFDELEKGAAKHRKQWHQEVDNIFDKLESMIKTTRKNFLISERLHESKLKNLITDMIQTVEQNKEILKTNRVSEVNSYKSKLKEYRDIPTDIDVKIPSLNTKTVEGRELNIELGEFKASLTQTALSSLMRELLDKARVIATIPTGYKNLTHLACKVTNEIWVSGRENVLKRVDIHGSLLEYFTSEYNPGEISVTRHGELMFIDSQNNTVNIFRHGRAEVMIITRQGWSPLTLCCARSGDILVCVSRNTQRKILRYQGKIMTQEIYKDEHGNPIFKEGHFEIFAAENNNGDICVSDFNSHKLVVVDKTGIVRFRYDGTPARREKSFTPRHIVTDSMSQIIVTDLFNYCLHILDKNGQLLRCVDNCGLGVIGGLSVDSEERLLVGYFHSGEVKVIQYMK